MADERKLGPSRPRNTGNAGKGRRKGSQNKLTRELKDMILGALDDAGGRAYLAHQAKENPGPFMTLLGKVLPLQVNASGADGGPIQMQMVDRPPTLTREEWLAQRRRELEEPSGDEA